MLNIFETPGPLLQCDKPDGFCYLEGGISTWAQVLMSNIAALCYSDATHWWMNDTPLRSSHTHALCLSWWLHQLCLFVSWLSWGVTWGKKSLTLVEHRISAASGHKDQFGFAAIGWGTSRGGGSVTQLQHCGSSFFPFILLSAHHLSLTLCKSLPICPSADLLWVVCHYQSRS